MDQRRLYWEIKIHITHQKGHIYTFIYIVIQSHEMKLNEEEEKEKKNEWMNDDNRIKKKMVINHSNYGERERLITKWK